MINTPDDFLDRLKSLEGSISGGNLSKCIVDLTYMADECAELLDDDLSKVVDMISILSPIICAILSSLGYMKSPGIDRDSGRIISEVMIVGYIVSSAMGKVCGSGTYNDIEECMDFLSGIDSGISVDELTNSLEEDDTDESS